MEELQSLVEIVTQNKISKINIIRFDHSSIDNNYQKLYNLIRKNKFASEAEAAAYFFPGHPKRAVYFSNLKNRCKEKLINTILFIETNQKGFSQYQRAYYSCVRLHCIANIMFGRYMRMPAIKLSERIIKRAIKYEFTEIVISLARRLNYHYGAIVGDRRKYLKYKSILNKFLELQRLEVIAEEYLTDISYYHTKSRENNHEAISKAEAYASKLQKIIENSASNYLMNCYFIVKVTSLQFNGKYKDVINVCQEALSYFDSKKNFFTPSVRTTFEVRIIASYICLRRFKRAQEFIVNHLLVTAPGTFNWYVGLQYYLICAFHSRDLELAYTIVQQALSHRGFKKLYGNQSEEWYIYQGFVHYFIQIGMLERRQDKSKFRLRKFLNEVPIYSKDKRGANIPILVIQILFLLHQKKYGEIIDRVESVKMYVYRYLRRDETFRSNCFIKMLMQLPAASFHKAGVIRRAEKYHKLLVESYHDSKASNLEIEIVPYELLWECTLNSLENKHIREGAKRGV